MARGVTGVANEIWAALIQAAPVVAVAAVGWRGLNTWQTQLRVGRQVEHAERALAAAAMMFGDIRVARVSYVQSMKRMTGNRRCGASLGSA